MSAAEKAGRRILLVEDHVDSLEITAQFLRMCGHEVMAARSGADALAVARHYSPEVALLDLAMPGMDGFALADKLKEVLAAAPPRLIALTGHADRANQRRTREAGFEHHLVKPVRLDSLLEALEQAPLSGHPTESEQA